MATKSAPHRLELADPGQVVEHQDHAESLGLLHHRDRARGDHPIGLAPRKVDLPLPRRARRLQSRVDQHGDLRDAADERKVRADDVAARRQLELLARRAIAEENSTLAVEDHDAVRHAAQHGLELGALGLRARQLSAHFASELDQVPLERSELVFSRGTRRVVAAGENLSRQRFDAVDARGEAA